MTNLTLAATYQNRFLASLRGWLQEALAEWRKERLARETAAALHSLSDRELEDIGLSRFEIDSTARAAAMK